MDPVSIVGSVGSVVGVVFNLSTKLYSFIQATKVVDKSIEALYDEVKALENILNTTQTTLTATVRDYAEDCSLSVHGLWTSIDNGVQDCRVTVEALNSLVQNIGQNTETSNPFRKMLKQVKLNLNTDEVSAVRSRVHTHSICLQLAMQTLSVVLSCSSITNINRIAIPDLGVNTSKLDQLVSDAARADMASNFEAQLPEAFQNPELRNHTKWLSNHAATVLTTASTIVGAGSTQGDGSQYITTAFSEFGVPLDNAKRVGIEEWTKNIATDVKWPGSMPASSDIDRRSSPSIDQSTESSKASVFLKLDKDSDIILKRSFEKAERYWIEYNYPKAEKFLRICLVRIKALPASKQQELNLKGIYLKLAFTCLHQIRLEEAERLFHSLLKVKGFVKSMLTRSASTDDDFYKIHASFGLAQIYICQNLLADAELMCQRCIDHWKTITTMKTNSLYSKSLQLMAFIHQEREDPAVARIYSELAVDQGLEPNGRTPYMLIFEQIEFEYWGRKTKLILLALGYKVPKKDFKASKALEIVIDARDCNETETSIGPGKLGHVLTLTSGDVKSVVKYLLAAGADKDTSLRAACAKRRVFIAQQLCDSGADVNVVDNWGRTPLLYAVMDRRMAVVELLCDRGADLEMVHQRSMNLRALHFAVMNRDLAIVIMLLGRGALVSPRDTHGHTPLHIAALISRLDIVQVLCNAGAEVDARDARGKSPLICALLESEGPSYSEDLAIAKLLCEKGADVLTKRADGHSALAYAAPRGPKFVKMLKSFRKGSESISKEQPGE